MLIVSDDVTFVVVTQPGNSNVGYGIVRTILTTQHAVANFQSQARVDGRKLARKLGRRYDYHDRYPDGDYHGWLPPGAKTESTDGGDPEIIHKNKKPCHKHGRRKRWEERIDEHNWRE